MGNIQQLHIKTEAIDCRSFNNRPADAHAKSLEATLRVPEGKTGRQPHSEIENAAALFAPPRLVNANQTSVKRSRTKGQIAFAAHDRVDEFRSFRDRRREIGVGEQRNLAARSQQTQSDGASFSQVRLITDD